MSSPADSVARLPDRWPVVRLGAIGRFSASGIDKKSIEDEQSVRMVNYTDVYGSKAKALDGSSDLMAVTCSCEKLAEHSLRRGDLLFTPSSETKDEIGFSAVVTRDLPDTVYSYHLVRFRPSADVKLDLGFQKYLCNHPGFLYQLQAASKGTTRQILTRDDFRSARVILPPLEDQRAIASFLDRETARIDTLIEKKRRLLDLLEEKRTALITRAVTRGLDPDVPMKDSGVQWIGEIPRHWDVGRLPWHTEFREGPGILAKDFRSEGIPLVRIGNLQGGLVTTDFEDFLSPGMVTSKWSHMRVREGDLLVSASATTGQVSIVPKDVEGAVPYTGLIRFRPKSTVTAGYLRQFMSSPAFLFQVNALKTGVAIQHFGPTHLRRVHIPLPPLAEQRAIAASTDHADERIDRLMRRTAAAIALLLEYRTALISAVVTGTMDVSTGETGR